jgi:hypothetical protein
VGWLAAFRTGTLVGQMCRRYLHPSYKSFTKGCFLDAPFHAPAGGGHSKYKYISRPGRRAGIDTFHAPACCPIAKRQAAYVRSAGDERVGRVLSLAHVKTVLVAS